MSQGCACVAGDRESQWNDLSSEWAGCSQRLGAELALEVDIGELQRSRGDHVLAIVIGIAVASIAFLGHLWQLRDPAGRGLWDRLFGLAVIEDMVPSSMPERLWTPWGT